MIIDKIDNSFLYERIHGGIERALQYLRNNNFEKQNYTGIHNLEGEDVYVIFKEVLTNMEYDNVLESHLKYIDIHYVIDGVEQIGVVTQKHHEVNYKYDEINDFMLFHGDFDLITLRSGMFAIFFPDDLHKPEISNLQTSLVKKIVVKVKI